MVDLVNRIIMLVYHFINNFSVPLLKKIILESIICNSKNTMYFYLIIVLDNASILLVVTLNSKSK